MDERTHARYMSDIAYFLSKMEAEPNSGYFIPIALAYNKLEKYDETIAMCKTAVERFPSNCAAKTFLAEAYVYKGLFDQARELLFDVTAEDDNNYKALKLLGIICKEKGDNTEALKYLTGAFIRSPEDDEVRKMIDELGGTLNPGEIYDERMKRQSQNAADAEEDEDLKTYQEIDKRIRNAEIIMADLVSDTSINARNYEEEDDFHSDNPDDYMPLITKHEEDEEESLAGNPDDFLPQINKSELSKQSEPVETLSHEEESEDLAQTLQEENHAEEHEDISEDNNSDDLLLALSSNEETAEEDLVQTLQEENHAEEHADISEDNNSDDLLSALSSNEETAEEDLVQTLQEENHAEEHEDISEDNNSDDLLSALSSNEETAEEDLVQTLQEENHAEEHADISEDNNSDDLLSALSSNEETAEEDLVQTLQEENHAEEHADISEDNNSDDLLSALSSNEETAEEDLVQTLQEENHAEEHEDISEDNNSDDLLSALSNNEETAEESSEDKESKEKEENQDVSVHEEVSESKEERLNTAENSEVSDITESLESNTDKEDNKDKELMQKQVPSSIGGMTYDDMIDDDFQYGKIVDESYKDSDNPSIDLGESAPFTQGDIMDEILSAVGMTHDDMADDERINLSEKDRKLMRLENFLEKVQHNKESR